MHVSAGFLAMLFASGTAEIHPAALYGQLAPSLGHERQHAFDQERWKNEEGVKPGDIRRMEIQKLASQGLYPSGDHRQLTMRENAADMAGMHAGERAFALMLQREFPYVTAEERRFLYQIFYVAYAMSNGYPSESQGAEYSAGHLRANIPPSTMASFIGAFDVRPGDGMYLSQARQVRMWDKQWPQWWIPGGIARGQENIRARATRLAAKLKGQGLLGVARRKRDCIVR